LELHLRAGKNRNQEHLSAAGAYGSNMGWAAKS